MAIDLALSPEELESVPVASLPYKEESQFQVGDDIQPEQKLFVKIARHEIRDEIVTAARKSLCWSICFWIVGALFSFFLWGGAFVNLRFWLLKLRGPQKAISRMMVRKNLPQYWSGDGSGVRTDIEILSDITEKTNSTSVEIGANLKKGILLNWLLSCYRKVSHNETATVKTESTITTTDTLSPTELVERAKESWILKKIPTEIYNCRFCEQQFELQCENVEIATLDVIHQDQPEVEVKPRENMMRHDLRNAARLKTKTLDEEIDALKKHASVGGVAEAEFVIEGNNSVELRLPEQLSSLPYIKRIIEDYGRLSSGRIGAVSTIKVGKSLYNDSDVKALCNKFYLEQLLRHGKTEIFQAGTTVQRIIIVNHEDDLRDIFDKMPERFIQLLKNVGQRLWYALKSDFSEIEKNNHWDFAVLDYGTAQELVLVSETIHHEDAHQLNSADSIVSEISWRKADVEFYHSIFKIVSSNKHDLKDLIYKWDKERTSLPCSLSPSVADGDASAS